MKKKRIGILTGGGDCPGLNAVIRAVVKRAVIDYGSEAVGFIDGYSGLVTDNSMPLTYDSVSSILNMGGTILGSSNRDNPFEFYREGHKDPSDESGKAVEVYNKHGLDALVCIGGDGTLTIAHRLAGIGINVVGVPKTIDNDVQGTDQTFGFDTAMSTATFAIDKLRTTAASHHRAMVIELMGRTAGWLTLFAGIASGSDVIIIPEIQFDIDRVCDFVKNRNAKGKKYSLLAVSEGAASRNGKVITREAMNTRTGLPRLGGIGAFLSDEIENRTGIVSRPTVLGHLQRGGSPTPFDRILATRFGSLAAQLAMEGVFDVTVCLKGGTIEYFPLDKVANNPRLVPIDSEFVRIARSTGAYLGD